MRKESVGGMNGKNGRKQRARGDGGGGTGDRFVAPASYFQIGTGGHFLLHIHKLLFIWYI